MENVLFPSGAILIDDGNRKEETLAIYYGAVDAKTCVAYVNLQDLINSILPKTLSIFWKIKINIFWNVFSFKFISWMLIKDAK